MLVTAMCTALCLGAGVAWPEVARAQSDASVQSFAIPAGDLNSALRQFSQQSRVQLIYPTELVDGKKSSGLSGSYTAAEALRRLLRGSGLEMEQVNDKTVVIKQAPSTAAPAQRTEPSASSSTPPSASPQEEVTELDRMVVTGTHIRGSRPVGSPITIVTRAEIEASGYGRVRDFMDTLPQNFSGVSDDAFADLGAANQTKGQAVDLRGLGASSTLVLVNGRRLPQGGIQGAFVDISSIAASAVDRIEILPDGASAIYGADAVAGVVNFVLRDDWEGLEVTARIASTDRSADEWSLSVLAGNSWAGGNVLFGYEKAHRDALRQADRHYGRLGRDYRSLGGTDYRSINGNPGTIVLGGTNYAIPEGQDGSSLTPDDLIAGQANYRDDVTGIDAVPAYTQHSAFFNVKHRFNEALEMFGEARYHQRDASYAELRNGRAHSVPSTNPFYVHPTGGTGNVSVNYNYGDDIGIATSLIDVEMYTVAAGATIQLPRQWELEATATWGREESSFQWVNVTNAARVTQCLTGAAACPGSPLNVFGDGSNNDPRTLEYIRNIETADGTYEITSYSTIARGPLFALPAGKVRLAVGADYRKESLDAIRTDISPSTGIVTTRTSGGPAGTVGSLNREVSAAFGELIIPIYGASDSKAPKLEVSLAGRYEDYSDFGDTFNPKVGFNFAPIDGLTLRGSRGTSFRAPRFNELSTMANQPIVIGRAFNDPQSPTGSSNVLQVLGAASDIGEETADTWTAGFDFKPVALPGFYLSTTYFDIDYTDKILTAGDSSLTLLREDLWSSIIVRNPTQQQIDAVCSTPGATFTNCGIPDVAAIVYNQLKNLAGLRVRGVDFEVGYTTPSDLSFRLAGTHLRDYQIAVSPTAPFTEEVGNVGRPADLRLRGSVAWQRGGWSIGGHVNYTDSYRDLAQDRKVGSWTTFDVGIGYEFRSTEALPGPRLRLQAVNVLDQEPPFVNSFPGYDAANANDLGRTLSFSITQEF